MKLTFLGTGAADWDIFDPNCPLPLRRFSTALFDNDLLIDPGPHIFHFANTTGQEHLLDEVMNILVTHTHRDHFCLDTVKSLCCGTDRVLYGDVACYRKLQQELTQEELSSVRFVPFTLGQAVQIGTYTVTSLRANHLTEDPEETARVYLVQKKGRICFYGCDSAWLPTETWNILKEVPVNAMILELTCGEGAEHDWRIFEHNTLPMLELMLATFRKYGYFDPQVKYYVSHMARTLHTDHKTLQKRLSSLDVTPAFDGMVIEV